MTAIVTGWRNMSKTERRNQILGLLFVSPWLIGFLLFALFPLIASFYYSLTNYDFIREPRFIGLANYQRLFTVDPDFWIVMYNTLYYVGIGVPLGVAVAFLIANLLNSDIKGRTLFRSVIYIPSIVPAVCTAMVWLFILNVQYGVINGFLKTLGMATIPFLSSPDLVQAVADHDLRVGAGNRRRDFSRRAARCAALPLRRRAGGWRQSLATLLECHRAHVHAGDSLQLYHGDHHRFPGFHASFRVDRRRPHEIDRVLRGEPLPQRLCSIQHRQSFGDGLDTLLDHPLFSVVLFRTSARWSITE